MMEMRMTGAADLKTLAKKIRKSADAKQVRKDLTKGLKDGTKPALVLVKAAALALPDKPGNKSTGVRRKMARVANVQVRASGNSAGVRVRLSRSRMGDHAAMARVTNDGKWRHPVYGNANVWVRQYSRRGWFDDANRRAASQVRKAVKQVIDDIEKRLSH
jgi:BMFP domain-containing protein YqiC